ncbi:MAG: hypothetical protein JXR76_10715 [Deltaproteobacteria bacterium]|nr:hypothetical protein [Deltaproteobacteria bacterium]
MLFLVGKSNIISYMEALCHTTVYNWVERRSMLALLLIISALMLSCPNSEKMHARGMDSTNEFRVSADGIEKSGGDEETGVDVGPGGLKDDPRVGIEVPLMGDDPLSAFYDALVALENKQRDKVRVLHYGDSHTAADFLTTTVRRALQERFGDGGRGFVLLGKPWRSYRPKDIEVSATGEWEPERILIAADPVTLDGYYGLAGITTESSTPFARSIVQTNLEKGFGKKASLFDVFYMVQPEGGHMKVFVDGQRRGTIATDGKRKRSGFFKVKVKEGPHQFEVRLEGDGEVRLFGAAVESNRGLVYDALGVNGGFFYTPHRWNEAELQKQIARRDPNLIVTMYGTNESGSRSLTPESYKEKVRMTMIKFKGGAPDASCLMLGPPDRVSSNGEGERIEWIIQVQREVAAEIGCGFINLREMMGGEGAHQTWQSLSPPLAQSDGIHLTVRGYLTLGERIATEILAAFEEYKK